ncbi:MAG: nicotinate phosphoribosyltransferase [Cyanobacteria bacterium P01_F01_bin.153]
MAQETERSSELMVSGGDRALLTDLYQLTMGACYWAEGLAEKTAKFEVFARRLPDGFGYLVAMGLEQVLQYLAGLQLTGEQVAWLRETGIFDGAPASFWEAIAPGNPLFSGTVWAVAEGTPILANEPILRIEAPLWQAQWVETYLLTTLNYQTLIASRAAAMRDVAGEEAMLLEFGTRRAFGPQASVWAARAAIASGFNGTSNVLAAQQLGQLPKGTMAHALVMAITSQQGSELGAFQAFHRAFPGAPLLVDTFDTITAVDTLAAEVAAGQMTVPGVRLDSGDLVALSKAVRLRLPDAKIFASGDLDGAEIARLRKTGAAIDGYGIGTKLVTGKPVNGVYKLVELDGVPVMKEADGKVTYPGAKQIFRHWDDDGNWLGDRLGLTTESPESGEQALLVKVMEGGDRCYPVQRLEDIAAFGRSQVKTLPESARCAEQPEPLAAQLSEPLLQLTDQTRRS